MTTIAANKIMGVMAGDRLCQDRGMRGIITKVRRIVVDVLPHSPDGEILEHGQVVLAGTAGSVEDQGPFFRWVTQGMPLEKRLSIPNTFQALVLTDTGVLYEIEEGCFPSELEENYYTIGTGNQAAMAAMICGKNPTEAVEIACLVDSNTGGGVNTVQIEKLDFTVPACASANGVQTHH